MMTYLINCVIKKNINLLIVICYACQKGDMLSGVVKTERANVTNRTIVAELDVIAEHTVIAELGVIVKSGIIVSEHEVVAKRHGIIANWCGIVDELGINVTKRALKGVAASPRIASSPEHGFVIAVVVEHAPSGVGLLPSNMTSSPSSRVSSPKLGIVVTKHALSGVARFPRLVLLAERSIIVTERAPSVVRFLQGGMASSPERSIIIIMVSAINDSVTTK